MFSYGSEVIPMPHAISSAVQDVLDLFATELAPMKFGDLEATVLSAAADEVTDAAATVSRAEAALEAARAVLAEKQEALLQKTHRALAYARVYAEDDPALESRVERISLPRSARRSGRVESNEAAPAPAAPAAVRRGRPRKADLNGQLLEMAAPADLQAGTLLG
jgi:ElaB/YqjD/DUF883 family membrane-anchored ribosome-binding protein